MVNNKLVALLTFGGLAYMLWPKKARASSSYSNLAPDQIGEFFSLDELTHTSYTNEQTGGTQYNPPQSVIDAGRDAARYVLDPLRTWLDGPLWINSWYRSPETLAAMIEAGEDASPNSTHTTGGTVDAEFYDQDDDQNNGLIVRGLLHLNLPFDRIILEHGTLTNPAYVHIEYNPHLSPDEQRQIIARIDSSGYRVIDKNEAEHLFL